jgi:hypothetical protein
LNSTGTAAVHVLLQAGDFEIRIDRLVGLDQVALLAQPFQRRAQIGCMMLVAGDELVLAHCLLHGC